MNLLSPFHLIILVVLVLVIWLLVRHNRPKF